MNKRFLILGAVVGTIAIAILSVALSQAHAASPNALQNTQVTLKALEVHQDDVQAELCILMPSLEPWGPYATLTVDGKVIPNSEVALINAKDPAVMKSQTRCYRFTFPVSVANSAFDTGTLKLENLSVDVQGGLLSDDGVAAAKARLYNDQPQLDFKVVIETSNGGGAYIQILSKPDNMSDAQAIRLIQQASIDEIPGNWQTEIDLK
ncbi:MAG: hypothetical protein Q7U68_06635 [Candidatus Roizmanbacteria bacterium]|nr:hypothetical protein [Candidatus Roizmanbacteria bacterium]